MNVYNDILFNDNFEQKVIRHYKIIKDKESYDVYDDYGTRELQHKIDAYENNLFISNPISINYDYQDNTIEFSRYNDLKELKNLIQNEQNNFLIFDRSEEISDEDYKNAINECINNYDNENKLYIRFAPKENDKYNLVRKILNKRLSNIDISDVEINNEYIPICNDELIYSSKEVDYTKTKFKEKFNNE